MTDLSFLAYRQHRLSKLLKALDEMKKKVRAEFFQEANEFYQKEHWHLPTTTWLVPWDFFDKTGMSREEFVKTRFPSWNVISSKEDDEGVVYVLRKKAQFMPWSYQSDELEITRSVSEMTPEVDWDSMKKVEPELFEKFAKEVMSYELDADAFNEYQNQNPQFSGMDFLTRYTKHKAPTLRVLSKVVENGD